MTAADDRRARALEYPTACARCGAAIQQPPTGRWRYYCGAACRVAAYRARAAEDA